MLIGIFYSQIVESSSLVSVLFREVISHSYISFFHLLVNGFSVIIIIIIIKHCSVTIILLPAAQLLHQIAAAQQQLHSTTTAPQYCRPAAAPPPVCPPSHKGHKENELPVCRTLTFAITHSSFPYKDTFVSVFCGSILLVHFSHSSLLPLLFINTPTLFPLPHS